MKKTITLLALRRNPHRAGYGLEVVDAVGLEKMLERRNPHRAGYGLEAMGKLVTVDLPLSQSSSCWIWAGR